MQEIIQQKLLQINNLQIEANSFDNKIFGLESTNQVLIEKLAKTDQDKKTANVDVLKLRLTELEQINATLEKDLDFKNKKIEKIIYENDTKVAKLTKRVYESESLRSSPKGPTEKNYETTQISENKDQK